MKKNSLKRSLLLSALSLFLCFSMLVGTTFAWFTDSVTSANNIIVAGNLDVELYNAIGVAADKKVDSNTKLFEEVVLWEPGAVAVENLTVANEGTLALKYKLSANIANAKGKANLADVLKVGVVEGGITATDRDALINSVTEWMEFKSFVREGQLAAGTTAPTTETYGIVIWWEPSAKDNDYNMNNGEIEQLSIELGVNLFATQATAEEDSFDDQYDANAPFSIWDGVVPTEMPETLVVDGATQTIHVKDAAAFAYLSTLSAKWVELYTDGNGRDFLNYANGAGEDYYYRDRWTVSIEADIDLNNHPIAPVVLMIAENAGVATLKGNNRTIRNINTTTGLFADGNAITYADLVLENVKATNGALTAYAIENITNVTVKNATISGTDYVGGVVGSTYGGVKDCKVIDSSVIATGKEAGGLIGYIATSSTAEVVGNTVKNVSVYAGNRAAGLVAQVNVNVKVYKNVIDTVTVGAADTTTYQPNAVVSNALDAANVYDNTVANADVATKAAVATDNDSFNAAFQANADVVFVDEGTFVIPTSAQGKTLTIIGNGESVIATNTSGSYEGCNYALQGANVVFENVVITTDNNTYTGYAGCNAVYNNCVINNSYTLYGDSEFNNCTFNISGDQYNIWTWAALNATFNNCTFNSDGKAILLYGGANTKLTLNDCTFNDKGGLEDKKAAVEIGNDYGASYTLIANNTVVNGYEINDKGINTGSTLWGNKNSMGTDKLNVVIDGTDVY